jgi:hypothetical protein
MIGLYRKKKQQHLPTIRHIPDDLWNEVKNILPAEKPIETIGRRRLWIRLLEIYDDIRGIEWEWQSLDSVSVKAPLGGI